MRDKLIKLYKRVKQWNWETIRDLILIALIIWGYYALCEWNCERLGGAWNDDKKICRR